MEYSPVSLGKLRLVLHVQATMENLKNLGFSDKDIDEVKGIFADTNVYLLGGTFFIAAVHVSTTSTNVSQKLKQTRKKKREDNLNLFAFVTVVIRFSRY